MYISDNTNFAALQHGQENDPVFAFSLWYLAFRSLALEVFKSPILLLLQLLQGRRILLYMIYFQIKRHYHSKDCGVDLGRHE